MGEIIHEVKMTSRFWTVAFFAMAIGFVAMGLFIPDSPLAAEIWR